MRARRLYLTNITNVLVSLYLNTSRLNAGELKTLLGSSSGQAGLKISIKRNFPKKFLEIKFNYFVNKLLAYEISKSFDA